MQYTYALPTSTSFSGIGLLGYTFGPLRQKDLEIYYVEVETGHDTFMISKRITRTYYVLSGTGYFTISDYKYPVSSGMLVEVPPKVEYSYSGKMELLVFSKPRWFARNDKFTKWNPDVVEAGPSFTVHGWTTRLSRLRVFGKSPVGVFLRLNQQLWRRLPSSFTSISPVRRYGDFLHTLARIQNVRAQEFSTFFLRNRPQLDLIARLVQRSTKTDAFRVAVLGCSTGAEAYSVAWRIRSACPDLKIMLHAVDISKQAVAIGSRGVYSLAGSQMTDTNVLERMTASEIEEIFDRDGDTLTVKSWIKEGIKWHVADVGTPEIVGVLGPQDIVVANNFLCHLDDSMAEACLRNIARLVSPRGYLIVSGVDLGIRTKVAEELGWIPLKELLEEIHEGDPCLKSVWPCHYGGLEPLNKNRQDWKIRYAAAFHFSFA